MSLDKVQLQAPTGSFDSKEGQERRRSVHRVDRFMECLDIKSAALTEGEYRSWLPIRNTNSNGTGLFHNYNAPRATNRDTFTRTLQADSREIEDLQHRHSSPDLSACLVEGRNGLVMTNKSPIRPKLRQDRKCLRRNKHFQRYVAAKQSQRSKAFATTKSDIADSMKEQNQSQSQESLSQRNLTSSPQDPSILHDSLATSDTSFESVSPDETPTSVAVAFDSIDTGKKAFSTQAFNFVRVETNQPKGIIIHHKRRSRREKKKTLTWWDDEVNADKPFLLRTDETPHLNLTEAQEIQSNCNTAEMLEVFEEYGEVLRKSISDFLFDWEYETSPPPNS
mmetsp:Transcript_18666/g.38151  ORF Transcript_18666/g.38151 Transcript_18666/m.38151 type:complete len:336 (-) Transcript_18666:247-1254(-)